METLAKNLVFSLVFSFNILIGKVGINISISHQIFVRIKLARGSNYNDIYNSLQILSTYEVSSTVVSAVPTLPFNVS